MRRPRVFSSSSAECGAMSQFDGYQGRVFPSKKLILKQKGTPTEANELEGSSARCSRRTRWQPNCWNRRHRRCRSCGGSAKLQGCMRACGVLARRRERGASNVLTTRPTLCMLGGHDCDYCENMWHFGIPPYRSSTIHHTSPPSKKIRNTHATYVHMCLAHADQFQAIPLNGSHTQAHGSQAQAMLPCSMMPGSMKYDDSGELPLLLGLLGGLLLLILGPAVS